MVDETRLRQRFEAVRGQVDERGLRLMAAAEARAAGYGGIAAVARATGIARSTIGRGLADLDQPALPPGQVRRAGSGRKPVQEKDATLRRICAAWSSRQRLAIRCGRCCGSPRATPSSRTHCVRWATQSARTRSVSYCGRNWAIAGRPTARPWSPARIPPPAPPVSPTGRGHGEALTPPETREAEHNKADQPVRLWLPSKKPDYKTRR